MRGDVRFVRRREEKRRNESGNENERWVGRRTYDRLGLVEQETSEASWQLLVGKLPGIQFGSEVAKVVR